MTELLDGRTLRAVIGGKGLSVARARDYALPVAHGLAAAHAQGSSTATSSPTTSSSPPTAG